MGREAECEARIDGVKVTGRALLEENEVVLRRVVAGKATRLRVPMASVASLDVVGDSLVVRHAAGVLELALGADVAASWKARLASPPSRLAKLGISAGTQLVVVGVDDAALAGELASIGVRPTKTPSARTDVILLGVRAQADLAHVARLAPRLPDAAALWVVWPKGQKSLTETHVREAALAAHLVDVKVARFSDALSALKLVRRRADRAPARAKKR